MNTAIRLPIVSVICLVATTANAGRLATIKLYEQYKAAQDQNWTEMQLYLYGVAEGISWAYAYNNNYPYCPGDRHFTMAMIIDVVDKELAREKAGIGRNSPAKPDDPMEPILLYGLIHEYPCKK